MQTVETINSGINFHCKWTLEGKSEHIVENVYHLVIFQKCIYFCSYYLQTLVNSECCFSKFMKKKLFHFLYDVIQPIAQAKHTMGN